MDTDRDVDLQILVLGEFRVRLGEADVPAGEWGRRNAAAILKILALAPGHRLHREQMLELLWPDTDPKQAANNLYQSLHAARKALASVHPPASDYLRLQDQIVHLRPDITITVDVVVFEQAAAEARQRRDIRSYQSALDMYGGRLLPDDLYESWASDRRESAHQDYLSLLLDLAEMQEAAGADADAIVTLRRLVTADPLHEVAHRGLMRLYARSGQRQHSLRQFEILSDTLARDLDVEPDPESERLLNQILSGDVPVAETDEHIDAGNSASPVRHNLPAPVNTFIGREREKSEVGRLLRFTRLLTLTGPGGCGKSRLSLELAAEAVGDNRDGVWLVELASLTDPDLIPQAIARALNVREIPGQPMIDTLNNWFRSREVLLVLDNCEHMIDACATLVESLLRTSPELSILATSREPLRIDGETTWLVPSLSLPDPAVEVDAAHLLAYESVQLFVDRAARAWPDFALTSENANAIAQICYRLDGIPLAIELAAARVRGLTVQQIVERLSDRFALLTGGSRSALSRQQTLRAALDWSYNLLSERERMLFARLSVFSGGFDLEAVEAICSRPPVQESDLLHVLLLLVDRSLVTVGGAGGEVRYTLLETMREYARERLDECGEMPAIRASAARYYTAFALHGASKIRGPEQKEWLARLEREHENLRAVLDWYQSEAEMGNPEEGQLLAGSLYWFWHLRGHFSEGNGRLARLLEYRPAGPARGLGTALTGAGALALAVGEYARARTFLDESIEVWRALEEPVGLSAALIWSGWIELFHGLIPVARSRHAEGFAIAIVVDDGWGIAMATLGLGFDAAEADEHQKAHEYFQRSLEMFQSLNDYWGVTTALQQMANLTYRTGDVVEARKRALEVLALEQAEGDKWLEIQSQSLLGEIARAEKDYEAAARAVEISLSMAEELGHLATRAWTLRDAGFIALAQGDLAAAWSCLEESLGLFQSRGYQLGMACCLTGLAGIAIAEGRYADGVCLLGSAQTGLTAIQMALAPADRLAAEEFTATARMCLGEAGFEAAWSQGAALSFDEASQTLVRPPYTTPAAM